MSYLIFFWEKNQIHQPLNLQYFHWLHQFDHLISSFYLYFFLFFIRLFSLSWGWLGTCVMKWTFSSKAANFFILFLGWTGTCFIKITSLLFSLLLLNSRQFSSLIFYFSIKSFPRIERHLFHKFNFIFSFSCKSIPRMNRYLFQKNNMIVLFLIESFICFFSGKISISFYNFFWLFFVLQMFSSG